MLRKNFEHTADIGIEVESSNLSEAFEEVSLSFSEIITGGNLPKSSLFKEVNLEADNLDSLLVDFMSYLIVLTPIITGNKKRIGTTVGYNQAAVRMALSFSAI